MSDYGTCFKAIMFWATPALTSAQRILDNKAAFSPWHKGEADFLAEHERSSEGAMMLLALRNVERAAIWVAEERRDELGDLTEVFEQFWQMMPGLIVARDALEHFDEYATGRGRLQKGNDTRYDYEFIAEPRPVVSVGPVQIDVEFARDACRWLVISLLARMEESDGTGPGADPAGT